MIISSNEVKEIEAVFVRIKALNEARHEADKQSLKFLASVNVGKASWDDLEMLMSMAKAKFANDDKIHDAAYFYNEAFTHALNGKVSEFALKKSQLNELVCS